MSRAKVIKMAGSKGVAKNITGLTKGKRYYVSVRSYKTVGKKTYSKECCGQQIVKQLNIIV